MDRPARLGIFHTVFQNITDRFHAPGHIARKGHPRLHLTIPADIPQIHGHRNKLICLLRKLCDRNRLLLHAGCSGVQPRHFQKCIHQPVDPAKQCHNITRNLTAALSADFILLQKACQKLQRGQRRLELMRNICQRICQKDLVLLKIARLLPHSEHQLA